MRLWHLTINLALLVCILIFKCETEKDPFANYPPDVPGAHLVGIKNYQHIMWIGTYSDSLAVLLQSYLKESKRYWIGGAVVPADSCRHGFYFDPHTITAAESTVEGMQTTIKQIRQDPRYYQNNGWSNALAEHAWYVAARFLKYRESG